MIDCINSFVLQVDYFVLRGLVEAQCNGGGDNRLVEAGQVLNSFDLATAVKADAKNLSLVQFKFSNRELPWSSRSGVERLKIVASRTHGRGSSEWVFSVVSDRFSLSFCCGLTLMSRMEET